jgi:hypothetical protein
MAIQSINENIIEVSKQSNIGLLGRPRQYSIEDKEHNNIAQYFFMILEKTKRTGDCFEFGPCWFSDCSTSRPIQLD